MRIEIENWESNLHNKNEKWNWNWNWNLIEIEINLKLKFFTCSVVDLDFDLRFEKEKKNRPRRRGRRLDFDVWWGRWQEISTSTRVTRRLNFDRNRTEEGESVDILFRSRRKRTWGRESRDDSSRTVASNFSIVSWAGL